MSYIEKDCFFFEAVFFTEVLSILPTITYDGREGRTMNSYYFTFRSVTQAQNAVFVLKRYGIDGVLVSDPAALTQRGCGYAVQVKSRDGYRSAAILREEGIHYIKAYKVNALGLEEAML